MFGWRIGRERVFKYGGKWDVSGRFEVVVTVLSFILVLESRSV